MTGEELDALINLKLEEFNKLWRRMGLTEEECREREYLVLEQFCNGLLEIQTTEQILLLNTIKDVEMKKRRVEVLQAQLHLERMDFTRDQPRSLLDSVKYYEELLIKLETEKKKRIELYDKLRDRMADVCRRLGEEYAKPSNRKVPAIFELNRLGAQLQGRITLLETLQQIYSHYVTQTRTICSLLHYVPENRKHRDILFELSDPILSSQAMSDARQFYDEVKAKYDEYLKQGGTTQNERLRCLEQCWDNCKISHSDRTAFLNSLLDKSASDIREIIQDEIRRLNHYYALRKEIFDKVDRWIDLWKAKANMKARFPIGEDQLTEKDEESSLNQQLIKMQLDVKRSADAWRRKNPGRLLLYEGESIEDRVAFVENSQDNISDAQN